MLPPKDTPEFRNLLHEQVEKRRTFAIISHPDAGKTTLTEKLLLYGGADRKAAALRRRHPQRGQRQSPENGQTRDVRLDGN